MSEAIASSVDFVEPVNHPDRHAPGSCLPLQRDRRTLRSACIHEDNFRLALVTLEATWPRAAVTTKANVAMMMGSVFMPCPDTRTPPGFPRAGSREPSFG
jgi:hypothetical protein